MCTQQHLKTLDSLRTVFLALMTKNIRETAGTGKLQPADRPRPGRRDLRLTRSHNGFLCRSRLGALSAAPDSDFLRLSRILAFSDSETGAVTDSDLCPPRPNRIIPNSDSGFTPRPGRSSLRRGTLGELLVVWCGRRLRLGSRALIARISRPGWPPAGHHTKAEAAEFRAQPKVY